VTGGPGAGWAPWASWGDPPGDGYIPLRFDVEIGPAGFWALVGGHGEPAPAGQADRVQRARLLWLPCGRQTGGGRAVATVVAAPAASCRILHPRPPHLIGPFSDPVEGDLPRRAARQPERAPPRRGGVGGQPVGGHRAPARGVPLGDPRGLRPPDPRPQPPVGCVKKREGRVLSR